MISVEITDSSVDDRDFGPSEGSGVGAELVFKGVVRAIEKGQPIRGLVYEYYDGMAQSEMERIARLAMQRFGITELHCVHRVGTIPAGKAAIVVLIRSKHREEAFSAMSWFMNEVKRTVPIWKIATVTW